MQRGIFKISKISLISLINSMNFNTEKLKDTPLKNKIDSLKSLLENSDLVSFDIELSEEEIEIILDEIGIPESNEGEGIKQLRLEIMNMYSKLRS